MSARRNFDKLERVADRVARVHASRDDASLLAMETRRSQNLVDQRELRRVMAHPNFAPECVERAEEMLAWLTKYPTRDLAPGYRERLRRWSKVLQMIDQGHAIDPSKRKPMRPRPEKPALPAWMNDPSLLPKRPPGRAAE